VSFSQTGRADKRQRRRLFPLPVFLYLFPLAFLAIFYFYPLLAIFRLSLRPEGRWAIDSLRKLVSTSYYLRTLWFTTWQAAVSTLLTVILAMPGAYVFARYRFRGQTLLQAMTTVPFVLPTIVVAVAFSALIGPRGWVNAILMRVFSLNGPPLNLQHTLWAIFLAHVFYNYTVVLRIVGGFWANLDPQVEEVARTLGADRWRTFREITLPLLTPAIAAASLLVFIFCFTSFGVILILGGPRYATLEVEIYRQAAHLFNLPVAAALSIAQIMFTFGLMWVYTAVQARSAVPLQPRSRWAAQRKPANRQEWTIVIANVVFMLLLLITPLAALAERSFSVGRAGYTLAYYRTLGVNTRGLITFVPPLEAVRNSLGFAGVTVVLGLALGLTAAYLLTRGRGRVRSLLDPVFMLPLGTSAVTLGFGYIVALGRPPLNLRTSPLLIPLAHTLVAFPFVVRSILPALRGIHPHLREAALVLGASPRRVWWEIDLPIIGRALLVGAVFAFTVSMGEFGATIFIARPQVPTMPIAIYRLLGQPGVRNYGQALAMSTLLMLVCTIGFVAIERFRAGGVGEF
jgi:thiamine transport system permease protein